MKSKSKKTVKVNFSPEVMAALRAEAELRKISLDEVVEEMARVFFLGRCGTPANGKAGK